MHDQLTSGDAGKRGVDSFKIEGRMKKTALSRGDGDPHTTARPSTTVCAIGSSIAGDMEVVP